MSLESLHIELKYGSKKHDFIKDAVLDRRNYSRTKMADYHKRWNDADDTMRAYIPERDIDEQRKAEREYEGKIEFVQLEVPYNYAICMTFVTYMSSVFMGRAPVYQVTGRHGETQDRVLAMEALLDYQLHVGRHLVPLFNWIYDMAKYGVGIVGNYWDEDFITMSRIVEAPTMLQELGMEVPGKTQKKRVIERIPSYMGSRCFNVRPYDWYPDPRRSIVEFQRGEFCGRDVNIGWHELSDSGYFNLEVLRKKGLNRGPSSSDREAGSARVELPYGFSGDDAEGGSSPGPADLLLHEMVINIPPKAWGLGESDAIEKWVFTVANDEVVIGARPLGLYHNKFPYAVQQYEIGTYEHIKRGQFDFTRPLTDVLTWLFNTHFYAVRSALNDKRVVDPSRVVMADVVNLDRNVIRLKPEAYGQNPKDAVHQLQVTDPTQQHIASSQYVEQMIQRVTGVVDNLMGVVNTGGRKTATEVRTASGLATNRLKTQAEYNSALGWSELLAQIISNTQQFYDIEQKYKIAGNLVNAQMVEVSPETITGFFDFVPVDGTLPIDRLAQANFWKELILQLGQAPQLAMGWDLGGMLAHAMMLQGERNVDRFKIQVSPQEQLMAQAQAGNVVPLEGQGGGARRLGTGSSGGTI